ncbi:hypothetical protein FB451DRAFT_457179 [Mycena latifolia]|nr:hypothetical protein FB451DRAFT_457179 [Mycena latifolia]
MTDAMEVDDNPNPLPSEGLETRAEDGEMPVDAPADLVSMPLPHDDLDMRGDPSSHLDPHPRVIHDDLTLSQLSPRKRDSSAPMPQNKPMSMPAPPPSPMRAAAKRSRSAMSTASGQRSNSTGAGVPEAPMTRSKRSRVESGNTLGAPRVASSTRGRGAGRGAGTSVRRGRGGGAGRGRVVSAPVPTVRRSMRVGSGSAKGKDKESTDAPRAGSSSGMSTATSDHDDRPKPYTVPDFKALHASLAASQALHRSHHAPTIPNPPKLSMDRRAAERARFDEQVKQKEREKEAEREEERRKREEEEEVEVREMRRGMVPKAHEVPEWYRDAPRRGGRGEGAERSE